MRFECSRWSGVPRLLKADKAAELRWFDLDALPTPVVGHELFVLGTLADGGSHPGRDVRVLTITRVQPRVRP